MQAITEFFVNNMIAVYFFYGLAFFTMGVALALTTRQTSRLRFARALPCMAAFGILHGIHEWFEMGQRIALETRDHAPALPEESLRLFLLVTSFVMLLCFALQLLTPAATPRRRVYAPAAALALVWALVSVLFARSVQAAPLDAIAIADGLARYLLAIPGAALAAWALMREQRALRMMDLAPFSRDMVSAAAALLLYGVIGQLFVRPGALPWTAIFSTDHFLDWFGIPVQLFRAVMAIALTFFLMRVMNAFAVEHRRQLERADRERLAAQRAVLETERRSISVMESMNDELRLATHKLSLLLDVSNLLDLPGKLDDRVRQALERIIEALPFADAGLVLIARWDSRSDAVMGATGFRAADADGDSALYAQVAELGRICVARGLAMCRHVDGAVIEFDASAETGNPQHKCRAHGAPTTMIGYPVTAHHQVYGSIVLVRLSPIRYRPAPSEMALMAGVAQQLGISIENALLTAASQRHGQQLAELLRQIVDAQESERQRIARELHDATGQSLTAVGLGLRGVETQLEQSACDPALTPMVTQVRELRIFAQNALGELRNIISDLRPPQLDELGLAAALRWYVQSYAHRRRIEAHFTCTGDDSRLPLDYRTVLFRIAQEALTNVAKHTHASEVAVTLHITADCVDLEIADNGDGFDAALLDRLTGQSAVGWGVIGMRERALLLDGNCVIDTAPGAGTRVRVTAPLQRDNSLLVTEGSIIHDER
ncbi:MAG: GAF domain-containing sensor histidine kinase [Caldilinea sp.]